MSNERLIDHMTREEVQDALVGLNNMCNEAATAFTELDERATRVRTQYEALNSMRRRYERILAEFEEEDTND